MAQPAVEPPPATEPPSRFLRLRRCSAWARSYYYNRVYAAQGIKQNDWKGWIAFIVLMIIFAWLFFDFVVELVNTETSGFGFIVTMTLSVVLSLITALSISSWVAHKVSDYFYFRNARSNEND